MIKRNSLRNLGLFCLAACLLVASVAGQRAVAAEAVTTTDAAAPLDRLTLLLKPLTKDEIAVEVKAWQSLLQTKVWQISQAQIVLNDENEALGHLDEIAADITKIQEHQTSVREAQQAARTEPSAEATDSTPVAAAKGRATDSTAAAELGDDDRVGKDDLAS